MTTKKHLAIDIGASSGRHIVGWHEDGKLQTREVYRFPNFPDERDGHLVWDVERLFGEIKLGIAAATEQFGEISSLAIDTWGIDYVLLCGKREISPCYCYRDSRTQGVIREVHSIIPFPELYERTGIQFQPFNTIYQLYADKAAGRLDNATDFLMLPEYFTWRLTGRKCREYTNATTTGLVSVSTREYDGEIIEKLGLPARLFAPLTMPGALVGDYASISVKLCPSHDTASAFAAVDTDNNTLLLSSGTWSLLGAKLPQANTGDESRRANFTNEGGAGYIRYLKNIAGLWVLNQLRNELSLNYSEAAQLAGRSAYNRVFDINAPQFTAPGNMAEKIRAVLPDAKDSCDLIAAVYHSLAYSYGETVRELEYILNRNYDKIVITGGGAKDELLNTLTARYTGKQVLPLPIEATAIGNLKSQMEDNYEL